MKAREWPVMGSGPALANGRDIRNEQHLLDNRIPGSSRSRRTGEETRQQQAQPQSPLTDAEHSRQLRRAVIASTVGTVIEAYDFLLYVLVAPLVFAHLYFPASDPLVGTLQAFGIYAVGFVARPVGAALFGHYGDRIGRKATLIATLLLTGSVDLRRRFRARLRCDRHLGRGHPDGRSVYPGCRARRRMGRGDIDGDGMGEDRRPSRLHHLVAAMGRPRRAVLRQSRGIGVQRDLGRPVSCLGLARAVLALIVMVGIGLYIRLGILETPVFRADSRRTPRRAHAGASKCIKRQPKQIILTALARMAEQGPFYVYAAFLFTYGTTVLHSSRDLLLTALLTATGLSAVTIPLSGYISDRIGRKRMYLIGAVATGLFGFVYFAMMNTASRAGSFSPSCCPLSRTT